MTAATSNPKSASSEALPELTINDLVLLRVAAASATRAELQRDLAALVAPTIPGTAFRRSAELAIGQHSARHLLSEQRGRLTATSDGQQAAGRLLAGARAIPITYPADWQGVTSALLVRALSLKAPSAAIPKALNRPEGLAALILQKHFDLAADRVLSPTTLRSELAVVALERAFGNKIKTGLGKGTGLPGKAGRVLAGQLFKHPRELATDGKLVLALAAEIAAAPDASLDGLRLAVLRRLTQSQPRALATVSFDAERAKPAPAANDASPLPASRAHPASAHKRAVERPDMPEFASAVVSAARPVSEGWPGNRKAFISLVWNAIRNTRPEWELSEIAFKGMLAEAHRTGHVVLAGADLKDKCDLKELEDSKILYKNTVWHFVRVED